MRVSWKRAALDDLKSLKEWLATRPNALLSRAIQRVRDAGNALERLGDIGRPSQISGARELSVRDVPYVIVYRQQGDHYVIIAVFHTAQER